MGLHLLVVFLKYRTKKLKGKKEILFVKGKNLSKGNAWREHLLHG